MNKDFLNFVLWVLRLIVATYFFLFFSLIWVKMVFAIVMVVSVFFTLYFAGKVVGVIHG